MEKKIGHYSFVIGVIIALVLGLIPAATLGATATAALGSILIVLGLIVGFLNVADKQTKDFLLVATVLVIVAGIGGASATLGSIEFIGDYVAGIFKSLLTFLIPATVVVALKDILALARVK